MPAPDPQSNFTWPPKAPIPKEALPPAPPATLSTTSLPNAPQSRLPAPTPRHAWWRAIEHTWLGLVTPSFPHRAADANWSPDPTSAYCQRCGHPVGPHEPSPDAKGQSSCTNCKGTRPRYSRVVRLGPFDGLLRDAIHELKFTAWRRIGTELGHLLAMQLAFALDAADISLEQVVLVPMPTTTRRRLARGIDHTTVLARAMRRTLRVPVLHAVSREHRPSQTLVPASQRRDNVARTMSMKPRSDLFGKLVVIVDDVMTTGSTMSECARALREGAQGEKNAPLDVWAAVLAVAAEEPRSRPAPPIATPAPLR